MSSAGFLSQDLAAQLRQLLLQLASTDNAQRSQAEQQLNQIWITQQADVLLAGLAHLGRHDTSVEIRSFAAVLFRRLAFKTMPTGNIADQTAVSGPGVGDAFNVALWDTVTGDTRARCMQELLLGLKDETIVSVLHKLSDTVAEVYKNCHSRGQPWDKLQTLLLELCTSEPAMRRECAMRIFATVPMLMEQLPPENMHAVFARCLEDSETEVRLAALRALVTFLMDAELHIRTGFAALIPRLLVVLGQLVEKHDDTNVVDALTSLIELAERMPKLLRPSLAELVGLCMRVIADEDGFEDRVRQQSLEMLLTLCEAAPSMMRKVPNFSASIIPLCLKMMADMEDDQIWYTTEDLGDGDSDENYIIGEQAMDRLARALGGEHVLPVSFQYIPDMLQTGSWEQRHAALMAISSIAEGCVKLMEKELGNVIKLILPFFRDPHPRVRHAACNATGQLSTDFAGLLQNNFHQPVLTNLILAMEDASQPRVQTHAAAALVNFCEAAEKEVLEPYMDAIFEKLMGLLSVNKTYTQEQAITTIATLADSAQDRFAKYYSTVMPMLLNVLGQASTKEYRLLRGKALECAALIALAVGREVFAPHAPQFVEMMIQTQGLIVDADDPQSYYLLHAWARICKVLGPDFAPYLSVVMPPLLRSAQLRPDFTIIDNEEDADQRFSAEEGWEFVGIDGQQFGIKTTVLEEKCAAVEMLVCYARELGPAFRPWVDQVMDVVLPLLKFYFHEGVRFAAASVLPLLLNCAVHSQPSDPTYVKQMWSLICTRLNDVTLTEADPSFLQQLYSSFADCVEELGDHCLDVEQLDHFTKAMDSQLKEYCKRLGTRQEERAAHGYEAEDEDNFTLEEEEDDAMLAEMSKALHMVIKTHRDAFFPYFERLLSFVDGFLANANIPSRQWALCLVDDMIEFTGPASWNYQEHFLPHMLQSITDESADVRQAAVYGIGMCAQYGGQPYRDACAAAIPELLKVVQAPNAREDGNIYATENAISAITKVCRFASDKVDVAAVLPAWLASLPIAEDEEEAPMTYAFLLDLLNSQHPALPVNNEGVFMHLGKVFATILSVNMLPEELNAQVSAMFKKMLSNSAGNMGQHLLAALDIEQRDTLTQLGHL